MAALAPHGTRSAYQRHLRYNEQPCEPCRQAQATWQRDYRKNGGGRDHTNAWRAARIRAGALYAEQNPVEWLELLAKELEDRGLDAARVRDRAWQAALAAAEEES